MNLDEYDAFVWEKIDPKVKALGPIGILQWGITKLNSEAGELAALIAQRDYHGHAVEDSKFAYEDGDSGFMVSVIAQALGYSTQHILEMNMAKLTQRGDYANYLREKMATTPTENPYAEVITGLERTLRRFYDLAGKDTGELDPAESTP